jgi:hypothetical protein
LILAGGFFTFVGATGGAPTTFGSGQRYLFVPFALYTLALLAAWSHARPGDRGRFVALGLLALIAWRSSRQFVASRDEAADWAAACRLLRSGHAVEIRVAPFGRPVVLFPDREAGSPPR